MIKEFKPTTQVYNHLNKKKKTYKRKSSHSLTLVQSDTIRGLSIFLKD